MALEATSCDQARASFWASELSGQNTGWAVVNGTCGGRRFVFGMAGAKRCEELALSMRYSSARFALRGWTATVRGNKVYSWVAGPKHRLDVSLGADEGVAGRDLPHGIIGQSFGSAKPTVGRHDVYPEVGILSRGVATHALAETRALLSRRGTTRRLQWQRAPSRARRGCTR